MQTVLKRDQRRLRLEKLSKLNLKKRKIFSHCFKWKFSKLPKSGVQEKAREFRYNIFEDWCFKKNIKHLGLSKFGYEVIHTCNDNGVMIDVSHIGEKSFWDIAAISKKPFIASHSSVHNLCAHFRNLKDDQIIEIKKSQGLIGLNTYPFFIES